MKTGDLIVDYTPHDQLLWDNKRDPTIKAGDLVRHTCGDIGIVTSSGYAVFNGYRPVPAVKVRYFKTGIQFTSEGSLEVISEDG